jgi:isopenicillin N synthase-like dioxygenase
MASTSSSLRDGEFALPIIDISPFIDESNKSQLEREDEAARLNRLEKKRQVSAALDHACRNVGFFYVTGHGVAQELLDKVHQLAREFFSLPSEKKEQISIYGAGVRGYQHLGENVTKKAKGLARGNRSLS